MDGAPLTRTPPRQSWGRGPSPLGVAANPGPSVDVSLLLLAVQRRRVESLVLGALSSSPVHRALVLVLGTNIAVLLDCSSRLDSVAFLPYLLTYSTVVCRRALGCEWGGINKDGTYGLEQQVPVAQVGLK